MIETACHIVTLYENLDNTSSRNASCQCKENCGGSILFQMNLEPLDISSFTKISNLSNSGNLGHYPKWIVSSIEDHDIFNSKCRCGQFGDLSDYDKRYYELISYFSAVQVATAFYLGIPIGNINPLSWVWSTFNVFYPFFVFCALFNIVIMSRMSLNDSMSFLLQLFQFIACGFSVLFLPTWTFQLILLFTNMDKAVLNIWYNFFVSTFTLWAQLLSLSLFLDRLFCIWKPILYNSGATRKKALVISLSLFIISITIAAINLFSLLTKDTNLVLYISIAGYLSIATVFTLSFISQLIILISFLVLVQRRTGELPEQSRKRQKNLNCMMIGTGITEMLLSFCHMLFNFFATLMFISAYYNNINLLIIFASILAYLYFYSPPLIGIAPFISLLVCICASKTYRKTCRLFFKCKIGSVGPVPPTLESRLRTNG